jgi:predicted AAA+ superfamily ATPase
MYIKQIQLDRLKSKMQPGKVLILFGPRRTGKTTLLQHLMLQFPAALFVSAEDIYARKYLESESIQKLKDFIGSAKIVIIDEAQALSNIGLNLKLIVDHLPDVTVIATGSSSFELAKKVGEPLTGRKIVLRLYPLSQMELNQIERIDQTMANLEKRLIYGSYPEVVLLGSDQARKEYLVELVHAYLYKDILAIEGVQKSKKLIELLQLLAFQIGKEVSYTELGNQLGINKATVEKYLDLLEQAFVIVNIRGFSRNLRSEVTRNSRFYFFDVGIRNALIQQFSPLAMRDDVGDLWENYLVMERLKRHHYKGELKQTFFWRTYEQSEIDWIEVEDGKIAAYEFKWGEKITKCPSAWTKAYPNAIFQVINRSNYLPFIT